MIRHRCRDKALLINKALTKEDISVYEDNTRRRSVRNISFCMKQFQTKSKHALRILSSDRAGRDSIQKDMCLFLRRKTFRFGFNFLPRRHFKHS